MKAPLDQKTLDDLRRQAEYFVAREERARERLAQVKGRSWYFALVGFASEADHITLAPLGFIQPIIDPPGEMALARAMRRPELFSAVGRYARFATHELVVDRDVGLEDKILHSLSYRLLGALRVKSLAEFLVPAVSDHSWSTVEGVADHSCDIRLLEDIPSALRPPAAPISVVDARWAEEHFMRYMELAANASFDLATEALISLHFLQSRRLQTASLWSAIEAIFAVQSELRFRIAALVASQLAPRGTERRDLYKRVLKLYDVRSKAVHGSAVTDKALEDHVAEVRILLSRILCGIIERGSWMSPEDSERALFE